MQTEIPRNTAAQDMAWRSVYFRAWRVVQTLRDGGYREFPAIVSRWDLAGGDIYGNGRAWGVWRHETTAAAATAQRSGIDFMTKPALRIPTSLKIPASTCCLVARNYADGNDWSSRSGSPRCALITCWATWPTCASGSTHLYVDMFLMLSQMGRDAHDGHRRVAERHQEKLLMLGPTSERQHDEKLTPVVELRFLRTLRAGLVPPPPPEMHGRSSVSVH